VAVPVVQFSSSTTIVNENDGGGTGANANRTVANLGVTMSQAASADVTVNYTFSDGTATGAVALATTGSGDFINTGTSITIPAGQTSGTIVVPIADDGFSEGNENFTVTIGSVSGGGAVLGTNKTNVVTINNSAPPSIAFSASDFPVTEAGTATVTVALSRAVYQPMPNINVTYQTTGGGAQAGTDYTAVGATQFGTAFQPGTQSQTFSVTTLTDTLDEENETVNLSLSSPTGGATLGSQSTATVTIQDDDP
jgi:hypothetical protein